MLFKGSDRLIAKSVMDSSLSVEAPKYRFDNRRCYLPKKFREGGPMGIFSVSQQEDRRPVILVPLMRRECLPQVLLHRLHVALHHGFGLCV